MTRRCKGSCKGGCKGSCWGSRPNCRLAPVAMLLALVSCTNDYMAPVTEQGERLVVTPPLIVDSSTPDSSLRAAPSRVATSPAAPVRARTSPATTTGNTASTHRVQRGDTLYSIAYQYDLDFRTLALANGLNPPYTIFVDQELNLEVGSSVTPSTPGSNLGVPVANNSVATARGTTTGSTGVIRQPIGSVISTPNWQWPHRGRIVRGFDSQTKGLDIDGQAGDPVYAAGDGDVVYSGRGIQGAGELIIIRHGDRYLSAYAHNSAMLVSEGDRVTAGQQIAEVGQNPSGVNMLHFEIRVDGKSVDPTEFLPRR